MVVNERGVAHRKTPLGQGVEPIGDGQQRVALAELEEGPWTAAVLGRYSAPPTDAAWIDTPGLERQDLLDAQVVLPTIDEVVLVT